MIAREIARFRTTETAGASTAPAVEAPAAADGTHPAASSP